MTSTEDSSSQEAEARSVGLVSAQFADLFAPPQSLKVAEGNVLGPIRVAYETYGTLSEKRDNAIFVCHALTGDAHVAGRHSVKDEKTGWWDDLIGPNKGLDTNKYFVICANVLGGCQGTTGPQSPKPGTEIPYALEFPFVTIGDMVEVHAELVRHLGIERLLGVIGGSLGGMQALEWAARFPEMLRTAVILASGPRLSAQGIAFNAVGRRAIVTDPHFYQGNYYNQDDDPHFGLALARMVAHITYLSEASIEKKFGRRLQHSDQFAYELMRETEFQIESYLHHQGKRFVERFDANSYLYLTRAMDYFDLAKAYGTLPDAFSATQSRFLVTSYTTDWLFPIAQSREIVSALIQARRHVTAVELDSPYGHDSFLLEVDRLEEMLKPFFAEAYAAS